MIKNKRVELIGRDKVLINKNKIISEKLTFIEISKSVNNILKENDISLNFRGYSDTLQSYINCQDYDINTLFNLLIELNLWEQYMSEIQGVVFFIYLKYINKKLYLEGFVKIRKSKKDKEKIDIEKEKENEIKKEISTLTTKINLLNLYIEHLKTQKLTFSFAYYNTKKIYEISLKNLLKCN